MHVVSDQQWVYHWLLFVGDDGTSAVVGTPEPLGFVEDEEAEAGEAVVLADSFSVFLWRWWMDNEAFFAASEGRDLTPEQRAYVTAYGPPHPLA